MYTLPRSLHEPIRNAAIRIMEGGAHLTDEIARLIRESEADEVRSKAIRDHLYRMVRSGDFDPAVDVEAQQLQMSTWLRDRCARSLGEHTADFLNACTTDAPVFIRVNTIKATVEQCCEMLAPYQPEPIRNTAVKIHHPYGLFRSEVFKKGWFEQQDITSQRVVEALDVKPAHRVIDACAGVGGKTLHLAALMQNKGRIIALDVVDGKLDELRRRARRAEATIIDARLITSTKVVKRLADTADRVLIDAPCSGTGVLRRNPDIVWHLTEAQLDQLITLQAEILRRNAKCCKPGGKVVYATCSVLNEEGADQVNAFLKEHPDFHCESSWQTMPGDDGGDGFYVAVLTRSIPS